jgi:hypothetical protein
MTGLPDRLLKGRHIKLQALSFGLVAWCLAVLVYGLIMYPDAPYKQCTGGPFCGKTGHHHSYETYVGWQKWEIALILSWPFGMAASLCLRGLRAKRS